MENDSFDTQDDLNKFEDDLEEKFDPEEIEKESQSQIENETKTISELVYDDDEIDKDMDFERRNQMLKQKLEVHSPSYCSHPAASFPMIAARLSLLASESPVSLLLCICPQTSRFTKPKVDLVYTTSRRERREEAMASFARRRAGDLFQIEVVQWTSVLFRGFRAASSDENGIVLSSISSFHTEERCMGIGRRRVGRRKLPPTGSVLPMNYSIATKEIAVREALNSALDEEMSADAKISSMDEDGSVKDSASSVLGRSHDQVRSFERKIYQLGDK
ncbi:hypothetical protein ZIOFF_036784 [Zingiber officinale]|uniref:Uncharacterized protein n=1 Tax=Zingiber officinale TaxID=94328 RepID=A0A8J5GE43_ZINOF|nr:hypothetical protein ZIOFF_036784 [Zingiber officinale]